MVPGRSTKALKDDSLPLPSQLPGLERRTGADTTVHTVDREVVSGGSKGGVTWVMTPPLGPGGTTGLPGAPPVYQGHHRPDRGTTGPPGAPQA